MRRLTIYLTIVFCFICDGIAFGGSIFPNQELTWRNIILDGKKTAVYSIYTDSRGLVWLGSNSDLYFYDGVTSRRIESDKLVDIQIYSLLEYDERLYLGSSKGLMHYDYSSGSIQRVEGTPEDIRSLLRIDNYLLIGTLHGLFRLNINDGKIDDLSSSLPHKSVYSLLLVEDGEVYIGTYDGLTSWNTHTERFVPVVPDMKTFGESNLFVNCLIKSEARNSILIGSQKGLYEYLPEKGQWDKVQIDNVNNIKCLSESPDGRLYIGTETGVIELDDDKVSYYIHDSRNNLSIANNAIWCISTDTRGTIMAGHGSGFSTAARSSAINTVQWSSIVQTGEGNEILSLLRDSQGTIWVGGTNGILRFVSKDNWRWYRQTAEGGSLSNNTIRSLIEDSEGKIWLSTDGGINRYNSESDVFDVFYVTDSTGNHYSNWVYSIQEDKDSFWVGSFLGGVHKVRKSDLNMSGNIIAELSINADTSSDSVPPLPNDQVSDLILDNQGHIWILLFGNEILMEYDPSTCTMQEYDILDMTGESPTHIEKDAKGRIWCSFKGGVVVFSESSEPHIIDLPDTRGDEATLALACVGDDMWISTQSNVWKIAGDDFKTMLLAIPPAHYSAIYKDQTSGKVLLGGIDGLIEVTPENLDSADQIHSIKMIIADVCKGGLNLSDLTKAASGFTIPNRGHVTFVFSTLNYSPASSRHYMYKLVKSNVRPSSDWIILPEGVNELTFSDLSMGTYELHLKLADSSLAHVSVPFKVLPPLALSWWAIILYIVLGISLIVSVIWYMRYRNKLKLQKEDRKKRLKDIEKKLTFLSNISHDLKTPLSMIMGPASLMKEQMDDSRMRKNMEMIYDNAVRLNNMIHRTLELNHLNEDDDNLLILSTIDIVDFCKTIFEAFKENNHDKKFLFTAPDQPRFIEADVIKLESVITNLLSNACKYSYDGATVTCGISCTDYAVEIVISDDGVGISETDQPLVFQRMFRAPSTAKLREGTGLGLYLIKKYLELMNGTIDLYSKEGVGTTFTVSIPVTEKLLAPFEQKVQKDRHKHKILIVEDNMEVSSFLMQVLEEDYNVISAENGRAGLAIVSSFMPHLIIADEMMPIMGGLEMCRHIKQNQRLSSIPVIMLTAKSDNTTENESIKSGIDAFMSKPFDVSLLRSRISQLLQMKNRMKENIRLEIQGESNPIQAESVIEKQLEKISKTVEDNLTDPDFNVSQLSKKTGIPEKQLYRVIKKYMGVGPLDYIRSLRLQKAAILLSQKRFTVAEVGYLVGFNTPSYFSKCFNDKFGVSPNEYQSEDDIKLS